MKTFIASCVVLLIIISTIILYILFLGNSVETFSSQIDDIIKYATNEDWSSCKIATDTFVQNWTRSKKYYEAFMEHREIDLINEAVTEVVSRVDFMDKDEILTKSNLLKMLLTHVHNNELPLLENIL